MKRKLSHFFIAICCITASLMIVACGNKVEKKDLPDFETPKNVLYSLIPEIIEEKGEIIFSNENSLRVEVYGVEKEEYTEYVNKCSKLGFTNILSEQESVYKAKNSKNNLIDVVYEGTEYKAMSVIINKPVYAVTLNLKYKSTDDFSVYLDDTYISEVYTDEDDNEYSSEVINEQYFPGEHILRIEGDGDDEGTTTVTIPEKDSTIDIIVEYEDGKITVNEGTEIISENSEENKKNSKENNEIDSKKSETNKNVEDDSIDDIRTPENDEDLAYLLTVSSELDPFCEGFANSYQGKTIKFNGCVQALNNHGDYNTRFDILLSGGDYNENSIVGPYFQFEDVACYDMNLNTLFIEDEIWVGRNVVIEAEVEGWDSIAGVIKLDPISVRGR